MSINNVTKGQEKGLNISWRFQMRNVNGLLLSALVVFAVAIVQLTNISVDFDSSDQLTNISVDFEVTDAHAQFEGVGCGSCPQLATDADVRLCKKQNDCNKPKPAPVVEPVVDPVPEVKPAKKPAKKRGKKTPEPVETCGDGTCDWENEDENLRETNTTCEKDCPCDQPWCQEECSGECTPTTCDEALEKVSTELETIKDELAEVKDDLVAVKDELAKPKVVKQTWISGIDNDMLIIYIMLTLILLFVAVPRIRKYLKDRKAKDGKPKSPTSSGRSAPGVG